MTETTKTKTRRTLSVAEFSEASGLSDQAVRRLLRKGQLRGKQLSGGKWRVLASELREKHEGRRLCELLLSTGTVLVLWHDRGRFFTEQVLPDGASFVVDIEDRTTAYECYAIASEQGGQLRPFPEPLPAIAWQKPSEPEPAQAARASDDGKRRCRTHGCDTILSRFNDDDRCALHA